jgi:hypothetical protein
MLEQSHERVTKLALNLELEKEAGRRYRSSLWAGEVLIAGQACPTQIPGIPSLVLSIVS